MNINKTFDAANERAKEIWLAGLGAVSQLQEKGEKVLDSLIKDGQKIQTKTRAQVEKQAVDVRKQVNTRYDSIKTTVNGQIDRLNKLFEGRVAKVLARFDIPTADDVKLLTKRVAELNKQIKNLKAKSPK